MAAKKATKKKVVKKTTAKKAASKKAPAKKKKLRFGVVTGGGDCPGLNPVIKGIVQHATQQGHEVVGFLRGWAGLLPANYKGKDVKVQTGETIKLTPDFVEHLHAEGGTALFSSRTNLKKVKDGYKLAKATLKKHKIDVLLATGGDDTLSVAQELHQEGLKIIGIPKTIDNDLPGTDQTFGFDTAANIAMEALDRLHTTARSHERAMVVEIMGRHAGWITLAAGMAAGAHMVLVPEKEFDLNEIYKVVNDRKKAGKHYTLIACAEGAHPRRDQVDDLTDPSEELKFDSFGNVQLGGVAKKIAKLIERHTGVETREAVLGHLQRGGAPTMFDRVFGMRLGVEAAKLAIAGKSGLFLSLQGTELVPVDITNALGATQETRKHKNVPDHWLPLLKIFQG